MEATAEIHFGDCIRGMAERIADGSVHLTVTSIPFEELFTYSGKPEDVGNNGSTVDIRNGRFALNMRFVAAELFRVTAGGCNVCIHIQQLLAYKIQHGFSGRRDFRGAMVDVFGAAGFQFSGEVASVKDPQALGHRLNLHSLQFKTGYARNGCRLVPAPNDYVLVFYKPGEHPCPPRPIKHKTNPRGWITQEDWIRWAHGCWTDVLEIDVLDGARQGKESDEEKHVCPLQLEVYRRFVSLYTNPVALQPDVLVLDPFAGIGSGAHVCLGAPSPVTGLALAEPRNFVGFELKDSYHRLAVRNTERALAKLKQSTLFG